MDYIRKQLIELAEEDYRRFYAKLLPNNSNILGVRLPLLRKIAKEIVKGNWRTYLETSDSEYFEEVMLQGMIIGYAKADIEEILGYVAAFIHKIDNWSVCDSFCSGLKITNKNRERVWDFLFPYLSSENEFSVRFAVVMMLNYYIDSEYINRVLNALDNVSHEGYYAKMAVAWAISACFIKMPGPTLDYLKTNNLDDFTYNKALQKIVESNAVDDETKKIIRSMKRK